MARALGEAGRDRQAAACASRNPRPSAPSAPPARRTSPRAAGSGAARPRSPAVEIAGEVEEIRLEQFLRRIERRADAEVGGALQLRPVVEPRAHRIDAVARAQVGAELEVGGRIADRAPALVAVLATTPRPRTGGSAGGSRCRSRRPSSASRMRLEETGAAVQHRRRPPRGDAVRARRSRSTVDIAAAPLPKVKSSPVTTPAAPIRLASSSPTKSSAVVAASAASKSNTSIASAPAAANSSSRWSSVVRRNGGASGRKWRTGCGSKVATIAGLRSARRAAPPAHHAPGGRGGTRRNCPARRSRRATGPVWAYRG